MTKQLKAHLKKLRLINAMFSVPVSSLTAISQHLLLQPPPDSETTGSEDFNAVFLTIQPAKNNELSKVISARC